MDAKRRAAIAQLVADALVEKKRGKKHDQHVLICGENVIFPRADAHTPPTEADAIMATIGYKNEIRKVVERVIRSLT